MNRRARCLNLVLLLVLLQGLLCGCFPPAQSGPAALPTVVVRNYGSGSKVNGAVITRTLTPGPRLADGSPAPLIFTGSRTSHMQTCGRGSVVAPDGHILRATPEILRDNANFLERLPEGDQVDIIDCRLWSDTGKIDWLASRTSTGKLGWLFLQPDKFVVTIYPKPAAPPSAVTGLPSGAMVAYVPPSDCKGGKPSTEAVATSIGIDFIPIVGDVKALGEAATGCDLVTGQSLGNWRWMGLLGLVGIGEAVALSQGGKAAAAARTANKLDEADDLLGSLRYGDEAALAVLRDAGSAAELRRGVTRLDGVSEAGARDLRELQASGKLSDDAVRRLAALQQPCSFGAGTPVVTPDGFIPIERVRPGQLVLALDERGRSQGYFPVEALLTHNDPMLLNLTVGNETIVTTPEHPFYVHGAWVPAGDLHAGDELTSAAGGVGRITAIEARSGPRRMYNLMVRQAHTFAVGAGRWWVHNACRQVLRSRLLASSYIPGWARENAFEWQAHHLIPMEYEGHSFFKRTGGWDFNSAENGVALPRMAEDAAALGLPYHNGPHGVYSNGVGAKLDGLETRAAAEGWGVAKSRSELQKLLAELRSQFGNGAGRVK